MRFAHLLSRLTGTLWLITEDSLANITSLVEARINGTLPAGTLPAGTVAVDTAPAPVSAPAGVAVIPVFGVIGKRLSAMEMACGGCDIDSLATAFDAANADANISAIVLHIDSPGGTVQGVPELAQHIATTKAKPVRAVSDTMIGSAAYYIAAAADEIVTTPTAQVGSIGTALAVKEATGNAEPNSPTRLRVFRSGEHKLMGADKPLTEAQAAAMQARVDLLGDQFRAFVSAQRGRRVEAETMQGLSYFGDEAVARGLSDRVVQSLAQAIAP